MQTQPEKRIQELLSFQKELVTAVNRSDARFNIADILDTMGSINAKIQAVKLPMYDN